MNPSLGLVLYRVLWLAVVAAVIMAACSWADSGMHGWYPEQDQKAPALHVELR